VVSRPSPRVRSPARSRAANRAANRAVVVEGSVSLVAKLVLAHQAVEEEEEEEEATSITPS